MAIKFLDNPKNYDYEQVNNLLTEFGLRNNTELNKVKIAFQNSSYSVCAIDNEKVIGFCRALSDELEWTLLTDLTIHPDADTDDVAGKMMDMILSRYKGHEIFTYIAPDQMELFEKKGFKRSKNAFTYSGEGDFAQISGLDEHFFLPLGYRYENEFEARIEGFPVGKKSNKSREDISIRYTDSIESVDLERLNVILSDAFGKGQRNPDVTAKAFKGSRYVQFAFDRDKLIGCARAESDGVLQGFILNVAVDPEYQGLHLGWEVVSRLSLQMKGENIFLNTHPGGVGFYNRKGFRRNKTAFLYPAHPDMPPEIERGFVLPRGYRFPDEL